MAVIDMRIRRADLPPATSQAIQSRANRERTVILAEPPLKARIARSDGGAEASRLFADAFGRDPDFFAFDRAMESYRHAMAAAAPSLVLSAQFELLRYFNSAAPDTPGPDKAGA